MPRGEQITTTMIKFLQVNLHTVPEAVDYLERNGDTWNIDVFLVSEPNRKKMEGRGWLCDDGGMAALKLRDTALVPTASGRGHGFVWISWRKLLIVSCYVSPATTPKEYEEFLSGIEDVVRRTNMPRTIVGGDFNAHAEAWGCPMTTKKGEMVLEWAASLGLELQNDGQENTFQAGNRASKVDLTFEKTNTDRHMTGWRVMEEEATLSDHLYITYEVGTQGGGERGNRRGQGGNRRYLDKNKMREAIDRMTVDRATPGDLDSALRDIKQEALVEREGGEASREPAYWWTAEIGIARKKCIAARRRATKMRAGHGSREWEVFRDARREMAKMIRKSKKEKWEELCREIDDDVWGLGYKIVTKKIGMPLAKLDEEQAKEAIEKLFPQGVEPEREALDVDPETIPETTVEEVLAAAETLATNKAGGPDGVPPAVVRALIKARPAFFKAVMDNIWRTGRYPSQWKKARLVLLPKPAKDPNSTPGYRPICLLNSVSKVAEKVIVARLLAEVDRKGLLSDSQHGFRKGRSTLGAIREVVDAAAEEKAKGQSKKRRLCALVAIDVRNAFNSLPWEVVARAMARGGVAPYIRRVVMDYLSRRSLTYGGVEYQMTMGVPQGSVLGPILWNLAYDDILKVSLLEGVRLTAYADDVAALVKAKDGDELRLKISDTLATLDGWLARNGLKMAPEKTEIATLSGRKKNDMKEVTYKGHTIQVKKTISYLGVVLDSGLTGVEHVRKATAKAEAAVKALTKLMPRHGGPRTSKRRVLASVAASIAMYGAPVWAKALKMKKYREILNKVQRRLNLRVTGAYRDVSAEAAQVLAGSLPFDLQALERVERFNGVSKVEAKKNAYNAWQKRWEENAEKNADITRKLIKNVSEWAERAHGELTPELSQLLTGHGPLRKHLKRLEKVPTPKCVMCDSGAEDDVRHVVEGCAYFAPLRDDVARQLGEPFPGLEQLVPKMMESRRAWNEITRFAVEAMRAKDRKDWEEEAERRRTREDNGTLR